MPKKTKNIKDDIDKGYLADLEDNEDKLPKNRSTNNNAESTKIYNISIWDEMNAADSKIHELKLAGNDDNSDSVSE
ncbi:hypothetical protein [Candidatus Tisiphia endosymbiont of Piscicola geometra]|uniref:hypothetical protein n=1 Tax=Candidatus Tisiphia endosymbiont of Piscicola geometra TaxID=3066273 RepID=UPI00312C943D